MTGDSKCALSIRSYLSRSSKSPVGPTNFWQRDIMRLRLPAAVCQWIYSALFQPPNYVQLAALKWGNLLAAYSSMKLPERFPPTIESVPCCNLLWHPHLQSSIDIEFPMITDIWLRRHTRITISTAKMIQSWARSARYTLSDRKLELQSVLRESLEERVE